MEHTNDTAISGQTAYPPYLEALNPEQREAVLHQGNPLLILAGAGSGKTRVITTKIAYLIRERGVDPRSILAVTFTNRAAREMAERARLIDDRAAYAMLRTFHSFGAWFLRRNGSLLGLNPAFVIYDDDDTISLLSTIMENAPKSDVKQTAHYIARAKDYFLTPESPELDFIDHRKEFRRLYTQYEERLTQIGNVDFGDLIKKPVEILRKDPDVARRFRDRFRVILVDEYQDANIAQFELLKELCGPETYVCVVGDDDQSIYRFRGAEVRNILEFPDRFLGTDIIRLERNYRSTAPILKTASSVVDHNEGRLGKTLRAERGNGKKPVLAFLPNQDEEATFCAQLIESSVNPPPPPKKKGSGEQEPAKKAVYADWAVLYRMNAQSLGFETEFLRRNIPYRVVGSLKFYEREEVKDALALLSFLVNPRDEVAFRRVVNKPTRGVGAATVDRIVGEASIGPTADANLATAARRLIPALPAKAAAGLETFLKAIAGGRATLDTEKPGPSESVLPGSNAPIGSDGSVQSDTLIKSEVPASSASKKTKKKERLRAGEGLSVCIVTLINEAGIAEYHLTHDEIAGNQRIANLQELANAASLYPATEAGLLEFLEHIELDRSMEDTAGKEDAGTQDVVTLITLHNTKGLEFRRVIMTGVEQGVFPRNDKEGEELEEERRLFYVGATRAMDELYLTTCAMRRVFGRTMPMEPSLFLREVDRENLRVIGSAPYGFSPPNSCSHPGTRTKGGWQVGNRLFHDDHGCGSVVSIQESENGPIIRIRFDTGKELHFLGLHQSSRITKIEY
ncbi:MAG: ATP-dependent helicase [Treponema sp.]|jgi:DNA helicase-2/ATP-dependent DNA helicase PcrA|nr:ATP-dependent helicase [Treponema sp.]